MKVQFQRVSNTAILPEQSHPTDAGYDIFSAEEVTIDPGFTVVVPSGWKIGLQGTVIDGTQIYPMPFVWVAKVCSRSGLAAKQGIFVLNAPGIVDQNYRGELKVILHNAGNQRVVLPAGSKIAQLLFERVYLPKIEEVESLDETDRGEKGFGSSGV